MNELIRKAEEVLNVKLIESNIEGKLSDTLYYDKEISIEEITQENENEVVTVAYYLTSNCGENGVIVEIVELI